MNTRPLALVAGLLLSNSLAAQSATDQQQLMQQMEAMQACMATINYQEMSELEQRSEQLRLDIITLCNAGDISQAETIALDFSDQVMASETLQKMRECAALMPGMSEQLEMPDFREQLKEEDICQIVRQ